MNGLKSKTINQLNNYTKFRAIVENQQTFIESVTIKDL